MLRSIKSQLPPLVGQLADEIESFAGREITVVEKPSIKYARCRVGGDYAVIEVPTLKTIDAEEILHELLHIERNWNQQVPQLIASDPNSPWWSKFAGCVDNLIEHLVIVPRMTKYEFEPYTKWNDEHRMVWAGRSWMQIPDKNRQQPLLALWPTLMHNVTDIAVRKAGFDTMRELGLLPVAEQFNIELDFLIGDKLAACRAAVKHLGLPPVQFLLAYCDPRIRDPQVPNCIRKSLL